MALNSFYSCADSTVGNSRLCDIIVQSHLTAVGANGGRMGPQGIQRGGQNGFGRRRGIHDRQGSACNLKQWITTVVIRGPDGMTVEIK